MKQQPTTIDRRGPAPSAGSAGQRHGDASLFVRVVMGPMTKVLNPIIRRAAGRQHVAVAQIHHEGRRSGRLFITPTSARRTDDGFIVPLTFGERSDWVRNVLDAGHCSIRFKGVDYLATDPVVLVGPQVQVVARRTFKLYERMFLKMARVKKLLKVSATPSR